MITKYITPKLLMFDGAESEVLTRSFDPVTAIAIGARIEFNDFANNSFEDLRAVVGNEDFGNIVKTGGFTIDGGFLNLYHGSSNLRLYYCKRGNTIIVFAYGEFQPTRYMLYLEGVWVSSAQ
ncbi:hypothetical protein [Mucilaginibacter sp. SP1R1]|uniref:hypothetical protein n=1 Tax=Mucilaginibacter sp. SP1R1 TaxID=2723091 RepID=UPI00161FF9CC|nr:hypothetical protein [Mucilaginibacter sp. SP1R1]MBB6151045.1 hypothetical protein [Mucilaginibacter sp. SP1R1]